MRQVRTSRREAGSRLAPSPGLRGALQHRAERASDSSWRGQACAVPVVSVSALQGVVPCITMSQLFPNRQQHAHT